MSDETTGSILADEPEDEIEFDATEAFLKNLEDKPEDEPSAPSEAVEETPSGDKPEVSPPDPDDVEFDVKVGDETRRAKLSDLKRLYGQEASLTQKSQDVAALRQKAETDGARVTTALTTLTTKANAAWEPYSKLDFLTLSTQMAPDDFAQLRVEAKAALDNVNFFTTELSALQTADGERNAATSRERVAATVAELSDPVKGIKGWGPELYGDVMGFAEANGMANARNIIEAPALRMIHKAMLYDRGAAKVPDVKKVVQKATLSLTPGSNKPVMNEGDDYKSALRNMRSTGGNSDSTADAFFAMGRRANSD